MISLNAVTGEYTECCDLPEISEISQPTIEERVNALENAVIDIITGGENDV